VPIIRHKTKIIYIVLLVGGISFAHYAIEQGNHHFHIFFGALYYLPIILASWWFGLRGALATSLSITACYSPSIAWHWQDFSPENFDMILAVLLYNSVAVVIGVMKNHETAANARLLRVESLAAMGRSLAAVAHDMRAPLVTIGGLSRRLRKKLKEDDSAREKLDLIVNETARLEMMMKNMLDFSRPLELQLGKEDINDIVQSCLVTVKEAAQKKGVEVECLLCPDLPTVNIDAMRLKQVVINLAMNATQASPKGEKVILRTTKKAGNIIIDVADCGCGIPPDQKEKIFNPFYTTKKEGTGLGLPIVKKIVEAHGGSVEVLENRVRGVILRVTLPS